MVIKMINGKLVVEDAHIAFRNFSGQESKFNRKGNRNFCIIFDADTGRNLYEQGWNVSELRPREEGDIPDWKLQVSVMFGNFPPKVYMITGRKKTLLDEDTIGNLDYAEIDIVDVIIRPYNWEVNGKTGVKAYADTMYVKIREDKFAAKYNFDDEMYDDDQPF